MRWAFPLFLLLLAAPAAADELSPVRPSEGSEVAPLQAALTGFNAHARFPLPALSGAELTKLAAGKLVRIREIPEDPEAPQRIVGLKVSDQPAAGLWLASRDSHYTAVDEVVEVRLTPAGQWPAVWYQHLDLPRPFNDRHWVVDVTDTHSLARATGAWEHAWVLSENGPTIGADAVAAGRIPGIDSERIEDAIYTPTNHGAWVVIPLAGGRSILGYHVTSVIGGAVPDKIVADYSLFMLGKLFKGVVARTPEVIAHYDAAHEPIEGGDGVPIPPHLGLPISSPAE